MYGETKFRRQTFRQILRAYEYTVLFLAKQNYYIPYISAPNNTHSLFVWIE